MTEIALNKIRAKAKQALLEMAKEWQNKGKVQHAIEGYEAVIEADPESEEAGQAKNILLEIAKRFNQENKKHSAYHLYRKLAEGRAGSHDRI